MATTLLEKLTIDAPAAAVWGRIRNFDALKDWHPAIAASPASQGNSVGSVRSLQVNGGGELIETLEAHDDAGMSYRYRATDGGALPVTNYSSTLAVKASGRQSIVEWSGTFVPDDDAAVATVTGVYQSGLANLKALAEAR